MAYLQSAFDNPIFTATIPQEAVAVPEGQYFNVKLSYCADLLGVSFEEFLCSCVENEVVLSVRGKAVYIQGSAALTLLCLSSESKTAAVSFWKGLEEAQNHWSWECIGQLTREASTTYSAKLKEVLQADKVKVNGRRLISPCHVMLSTSSDVITVDLQTIRTTVGNLLTRGTECTDVLVVPDELVELFDTGKPALQQSRL